MRTATTKICLQNGYRESLNTTLIHQVSLFLVTNFYSSNWPPIFVAVIGYQFLKFSLAPNFCSSNTNSHILKANLS